ncbi:RNA-guided endonuclease IscB [Nonomuraea turcica]|uniref:RNA-guided endonuclease IscB n=1 Tax=Nonomuraea sp. G32 TaxID=3067274 RepID=UPI00273B88BA|nr:RNA-guided endonuclease IscB [Nonomuraea sp. G32]MDP4507267.1 RNA-guided endonuclease IscB [Nonomuraea sp. G32]
MFVLASDGTPLDPCHPARARKLLASGRAVVVRHTPFAIRLKDRTAGQSETQGVEVALDPGSKHTGISVFRAHDGTRHGRYSIQIDHRGGKIRDKLTARASYRRSRRSRNLRYRAPRFANRRRPDGWLAPSLRHRVDATMSWVQRLCRLAPVRAIHMEVVRFDTHALAAGKPLEGVEYQHGTLHGYEVREYLLAKWGRACAYCAASGIPLNIDHIQPRSRGGSDRISNLCLACVPCNQAKNSMPVTEFLAGRPEVLSRVLAHAKAPLRDAAGDNATRWALYAALTTTGLPVRCGSGGRTKWNRHRTGVPKSHALDALHVGDLGYVASWPSQITVIAATGRGAYCRTRSDAFGFPRLRLPRTKQIHGYQTGDLVRALVPKGKHAGSHTGRVAVRISGSHTVQTPTGPVKTSHKHLRLLQRADGYAYTTKKEEHQCTP